MAMAVEMAMADEEQGGGGGGAPESDPHVNVARMRETKRQRGGGKLESARGPASSVVEVEVGEGAPVVGTPARARGRAGGAQTLAPGGLQKGGGWGTVDGGAVR